MGFAQAAYSLQIPPVRRRKLLWHSLRWLPITPGFAQPGGHRRTDWNRGVAMRQVRYSAALLIVLALSAPGVAQPSIPFADAGLHAVQFVDHSEGWAVGDDGVIWHSMDGG